MSDHSDIPPAPATAEPRTAAEIAQTEQVISASTVKQTPAVHPRSPEAHGMVHAVQSLLYIVIVAIFIMTFAVQPFRIPSESMESTLLVGDFLLVAKQSFPAAGFSATDALPFPSTPVRRRDVIVFHYPVDPSVHLVKRVIGLPGDHIRLHGNQVFIDGKPLDEPYAVYRPGPVEDFRDNFPRLQNPDPEIAAGWWVQMKSLVDHGELTVPPRSYFVLGDNRNDSADSRYWGFVPASAIVGKPLVIYFSVNSANHTDDEDALDADPTPRASALSTVHPNKLTTLGKIANLARWDRTFRVVR